MCLPRHTSCVPFSRFHFVVSASVVVARLPYRPSSPPVFSFPVRLSAAADVKSGEMVRLDEGGTLDI